MPLLLVEGCELPLLLLLLLLLLLPLLAAGHDMLCGVTCDTP